MVLAVHEAFNARRFDCLAELLGEDVRLVTSGQLVCGRSAVLDYAAAARDVSAVRLELQEVLAETTDTVVVHTRAVAVSAEGGSARSGDARQSVVQCEVYRIARGQITELRLYCDPGSFATARLVAEQAALRRVAELVARGAATQEVFDQVTVEASRLLDDTPMALFRYERSSAEAVIVAQRIADLPVGGRLPVKDGDNLPARVWRTGRAVRIDDDYQAVAVVAPRWIKAGVVVPVVVEGRLWGVLGAGSTSPLPAGTEERLMRFGELVAVAIANAESRAELTASRARVVAEGDEARRRLARDVHDGAQRRLVHALIAVKQARTALREGTGGLEALLDESLGHAQGAYEELRRLAHGILPAALEQGGLQTAVEALVADIGLAVEAEVIDRRLSEAVETTAYFVVAEALTNVVKHASAGRARVRAMPEGDWLALEVGDGRGGADPGRGSGLIGLSDRVQAAGGTISVTSPPGAGTTMSVMLPLAAPRADQAGPDARPTTG